MFSANIQIDKIDNGYTISLYSYGRGSDVIVGPPDPDHKKVYVATLAEAYPIIAEYMTTLTE